MKPQHLFRRALFYYSTKNAAVLNTMTGTPKYHAEQTGSGETFVQIDVAFGGTGCWGRTRTTFRIPHLSTFTPPGGLGRRDGGTGLFPLESMTGKSPDGEAFRRTFCIVATSNWVQSNAIRSTCIDISGSESGGGAIDKPP